MIRAHHCHVCCCYPQLLGDEGGTMVLVTHNMVEYTRTDNLTATAGDNAVWPILYPSNASVSTTIYEQLASISPDTLMLTVLDETSNIGGHSYQSVQNSAVLHKYLMTAAGNQETRVSTSRLSVLIQNILQYGTYIQLTSITCFRRRVAAAPV